MDSEVYRLELKNGQFEYTGDEIICNSLVEALTLTDLWAGVEINFVYQHHLCSLVIANDMLDKTTVFFYEAGDLFEQQWHEPLNRFKLLNLLVNLMKRLGASFCVLEPGWVPRTQTDIDKWLDEIEQGIV